MESNEIHIDGIGKINRAEWVVVMNSDDTLLLAALENTDKQPKLWVTVNEWENRPEQTDSELATVKFEKEPSVKFNSMKEATEAFMKSQAREKKKKEKEEKVEKTDMSTIPFEELEKLATDELIVLAVMTQGEEVVRDKLYCALGYCQTGCKSCKKDD
jgi:hypothetical protein